jgi:hypothetical protein
MKENKNNQSPPTLDKEPGKPGFKHGNTGVPQQEVYDEDVKAEQVHEKNQLKQETDDESKKVVNEEEQEQVVNNDEPATETKSQPVKMSDKPKVEQ